MLCACMLIDCFHETKCTTREMPHFPGIIRNADIFLTYFSKKKKIIPLSYKTQFILMVTQKYTLNTSEFLI